MIYKRGRNTQHNKLVTKDLTVRRRETQNTWGYLPRFVSVAPCVSVLKHLLCYLLTMHLFVCLLVLAILPATTDGTLRKVLWKGQW